MRNYTARLKKYSGVLVMEVLNSCGDALIALCKIFALLVVILLLPILAFIEVEEVKDEA